MRKPTGGWENLVNVELYKKKGGGGGRDNEKKKKKLKEK